MATLNLNVLVDVKGQEKLTGLGASMQRTGANLTKFVTLPLLGVGAASLALATDAQKSGALLEAAFRNLGKTSGKTLDQLKQDAEDLGLSTTFDDEAIMEAQAALLSFGAVSGDAFDRAIQGAADYAAATGKDVVDATRTLGKALADPTAGLARLTRAGVIFTDAQKEQVTALQASGDIIGAQNIILQAFEDRYAGVNAQLQSTDAGKAAQALEDLGNAGEEIGAVFLPMLAALAQGLSQVARWFTSLDPAAQTFIVTIGGIVAAVGPAVFIAGKLVSSFGAIGAAFKAMSLLLLANPFVALAAAVVAIAALIILNWDKIVEFFRVVINKIIGAFLDMGVRLKNVWEAITGAVAAAWDFVVDIIRGAINGVISVINGFFGFLNGIQIGIPAVDVGPIHVGGGVIDPFNIGLIPHLAEGGIITQPTLALLGEGGDEAVVPLDKGLGETHFHSHIEVKGQDPFIRNEDDLIKVQQRIAFLEGF